jgi:hypothetical protein
MSRTIAITYLFCLLILLYSCSKPQQSPPDQQNNADTIVHATSIVINPSSFFLIPGISVQLSVSISPAGLVNKNVSWSSSDNSIATIDTLGNVTALKEGIVNIVAISKDNNNLKATAALTVLKSYNIIIAGTAGLNRYDNYAVYWKNGLRTLLSKYNYSPASYSATGIQLVGDDIYICGNYLPAGYLYPIYWKNEEPHLPVDAFNSTMHYTNAIAVADNKVYLAGFYEEVPNSTFVYGYGRAYYCEDNGDSAKYVYLNDGTSDCQAFGIAVNNGDVIVAGSQAKDNFHFVTSFWKNNSSGVSLLSPDDGFYQALAVVQHGTDYYFSGYGGCPDYTCSSTAYVWTSNNQVIPLTSGNTVAQAHCMAFSGNVLYVGGYEKNDSGIAVATYWRIDGNQVSSRKVSDGSLNSMIDGIAVSGNDIFLSGKQTGSNMNSVDSNYAKCWRAYEGLSKPISIDISTYAVPDGKAANGIAIR